MPKKAKKQPKAAKLTKSQPAEQTSSRAKLVFGLALIGVIGIGFWWFNNYKNHDQYNDLPPEIAELARAEGKVPITVLNARVIWTKDEFRLINLEDRGWNSCTFELNRGDPTLVYVYELDKVDPKAILNIPHNEFKNSNGLGFDFSAVEPQTFLIRCTDVGGRIGLYNGRPKTN